MRYLVATIVLFLTLTCAATVVRAQEDPATPDTIEDVQNDLINSVGRLYTYVKSGDWREASAVALALLMLAFAKVRSRIKWFKGDRGGVVSVFILSLSGSLFVGLVGDGSVNPKMFYTAAVAAFTAIGGYTAVKRFIWPKDQS